MNGLTGDPLQTQLNGKQATITGAASTITTDNLTPSSTLVSDASGKIIAGLSATKLGYLAGVTGDVQLQINNKPNYPVTISGTGEDLFGAGPNNTPSFKRIFARAGQGLSVNTYSIFQTQVLQALDI